MRFFSLWQKSPIGSIGCNFIYIRAESEEWGGDMSDVVEGFSFFLSLFFGSSSNQKGILLHRSYKILHCLHSGILF